MPILEKLSKYKHVPVALIYRGADELGIELSKLLIEQGAFVIIVDEYSSKNKDRFISLLDNDLFTFIDVSGTEAIADSIPRLDYIFFFNHSCNDPDDDVATSEFLEKSNKLDRLLQLGVEKKSKFTLTSSIALHRILQARKESYMDVSVEDDNLSYTTLEVQRYAENLTWEYYKKGGLDARIVRLGDLLGEGVNIERYTLLNQLIKNAISGKKLTIEGDGLENMYFIHILDAAYGLIKAQFTENTSGKIFSLVIPRDITALNVAYKILDLEPNSAGIDFVEKKKGSDIEVYKPAPNLQSIGWKEKVSFERALAQTIDYAYSTRGKGKQTPGSKKIVDRAGRRESSRTQGARKKRKSLKNLFMNFFFEVKEEEKRPSVLDNVQYRSVRENDEKKYKKSKNEESQRANNKRTFSPIKRMWWGILDFFGAIFKSIRSLTLPSLIGYLVGFIVVGFVYFLFVVPVAQASYYLGVSYIRIRSAGQACSNWNFTQAYNDLDRTTYALDRVSENIKRLSFLRKINFYETLASVDTQINNFNEGLAGVQQTLGYFVSADTYLEEYNSNIVIDGETISVDSVEPYNLNSIEVTEADLNQSREKIEKLSDFNSSIQGVTFPVIQPFVDTIRSNIDILQSQSKRAVDLLPLLDVFFGVDKQESFALLLLDNNTVTPQGGDILAVIVFSIEEGRFTAIDAFNADEIEISLTGDQESFVRDDLKLLYPEEGLTFSTVSRVYDEQLFEDLIKTFLTEKGSPADHIVTVNWDVINVLVDHYGGFNLGENGGLNTTNFDEKITDAEISKKEILAQAVYVISNINQSELEFLGNSFAESIRSEDMYVFSSNNLFKEYFVSRGLISSPVEGKYDSIDLSFITEYEELPKCQIEGVIDISNKADATQEFIISFEKSGEASFSGYGIFHFGDDFAIEDISTSSSQIQLASSYSREVFVEFALNEAGEEEVIVKGVSAGIVKDLEGQYNYSLQILKPKFLTCKYEIIINNGEEMSLVESPEDVITLETSSKIMGELDHDTTWELVFE